jgi:hypothetical protein
MSITFQLLQVVLVTYKKWRQTQRAWSDTTKCFSVDKNKVPTEALLHHFSNENITRAINM